MLKLAGLLILASLFVSCHNRNCMCAPSSGLRLGFISFDSADIDTMVVRKYAGGSNFSQLLDTLQWDRSKVYFTSYHDTLQMAGFSGSVLLQAGFDYRVYFPALNKTQNISEISQPQRVGDCSGDVMCLNPIVSARLDGSTIDLTSNYDILYLRK